jgi:Domain of unknown function (DUF1707)
VDLLREHLLSGRLTDEEFEERVGEAWRARFAADLWHALRWLPVAQPPGPPAKSRSAAVSLVLAILSICLLFASLGILFLITFALATTAWALGREARRSGPIANLGTARAGEVLGVAGTLLSLMPVAGLALLVL